MTRNLATQMVRIMLGEQLYRATTILSRTSLSPGMTEAETPRLAQAAHRRCRIAAIEVSELGDDGSLAASQAAYDTSSDGCRSSSRPGWLMVRQRGSPPRSPVSALREDEDHDGRTAAGNGGALACGIAIVRPVVRPLPKERPPSRADPGTAESRPGRSPNMEARIA